MHIEKNDVLLGLGTRALLENFCPSQCFINFNEPLFAIYVHFANRTSLNFNILVNIILN